MLARRTYVNSPVFSFKKFVSHLIIVLIIVDIVFMLNGAKQGRELESCSLSAELH